MNGLKYLTFGLVFSGVAVLNLRTSFLQEWVGGLLAVGVTGWIWFMAIGGVFVGLRGIITGYNPDAKHPATGLGSEDTDVGKSVE